MELTKQQRKQFIEACVDEYKKRFPIEYIAICHSVKQQRNLKKNKFGLTDNDSAYMRWTLRLPQRLFRILDKHLENPRFLEEQWEIDWFKKKFKEFMVCEKT